VTLIAAGSMVGAALGAADQMSSAGLSVGVVNMHTVKPLDEPALMGLVGQTGALVTVEEHSVLGGLGGAVAEVLATLPEGPPVLRLGVADSFPRAGSYEYVLEQCGLTERAIEASVVKWLSRLAHR